MTQETLERDIIVIPERISRELFKAGYGVSLHGTVEICHWTKKHLRYKGVCYKRVFYGIDSHRCFEFSPAGMMCHFRCNFCWRPTQFMRIIDMPINRVVEPDELMFRLELERRRLMSGYKGTEGIYRELLYEAYIPTHYAISLSGEPTLYPKLPKLIRLLDSLPTTRSIFLVTNGCEPDMLRRLEYERALPTQLYISMNAPNRRLFNKIVHPMVRGAWDRFIESLRIMANLETRTVIRMTMIKGFNDDPGLIDEYVELLRLANPHFIEIKSYMHLGYSTRRLKRSNMLSFEEIRDIALRLLDRLDGFEYMDDYPPSRIVVLQNMDRYVDRWID